MTTLIVGMGSSGTALAQHLKDQNQPFDTFDDRKSTADLAQTAASAADRHFQAGDIINWTPYAQVLVSPGVPDNHPVLQQARQKQVPILGELGFAFQHAQGKIIAITGSNGKSTTASLIAHIMTCAGFSVRLCGNIGLPFVTALAENPDWYVVEVSSFQLEHAGAFQPEIGLLLNLAADHLDRHGSMEHYVAAKMNLFTQQKPHHLALVFAGLTSPIPGCAQVMRVPSAEVNDGAAGFKIDADFHIAQEALPPEGSHGRMNALFAAACAQRLGIAPAVFQAALSSFKGLEHRFETVGTLDGRTWINDSKATNVHAAQAAVNTVKSAYVLILGGSDKGERFHDLDLAVNPPRHLLAYGETAPVILEDLARFNPIHVHEFSDACRRAHELAQAGEVVLLAPACASFDQHDNFAARGRAFKALFAQLYGGVYESA